VRGSDASLLKPRSVVFAGSAASPAQFPRDGLPEVALLGRSNVGKSSLLNALAGVRNLARASARPGRTRLLNFFRVDDALYLADLPGYGYAEVPDEMRRGWESLVNGYLVDRQPLALCVFLVDARHEPTEGDLTLRTYLDHHSLPYVVAATKSDKLGRTGAARSREALQAGLGERALGVMSVSATTGEGIDTLWRTIRAATRPPGRRELHGH
jgi:GTP-binding protein